MSLVNQRILFEQCFREHSNMLKSVDSEETYAQTMDMLQKLNEECKEIEVEITRILQTTTINLNEYISLPLTPEEIDECIHNQEGHTLVQYTALTYVYCSGMYSIASELIKHGADTSLPVTTVQGQTMTTAEYRTYIVSRGIY